MGVSRVWQGISWTPHFNEAGLLIFPCPTEIEPVVRGVEREIGQLSASHPFLLGFGKGCNKSEVSMGGGGLLCSVRAAPRPPPPFLGWGGCCSLGMAGVVVLHSDGINRL